LSSDLIQYIPRKEINSQKWDNCIQQSFNGTIYAYSWYLDTMADQWDALVLNNYEAVMPLPWRKKYGIYYLYQPAFLQRLGIFRKEKLTAEIKEYFFRSIPSRFRYWNLNIDKSCAPQQPNIYLHEKVNYILDLSVSYQTIYTSYSRLAKRMIRNVNSYSILENFPTEKAIAFYRKIYEPIIPDLADNDYKKLSALCNAGISANAVLSYAVVNAENQLLAISILFKDEKAIYNVFGGLDKTVENNSALYCLLNHIFEKYANTCKLFDFEGSEIPGVAYVFEKFGAQKEFYYNLHYNNLPFPMRLFKK
jgi:hypothetical protein